MAGQLDGKKIAILATDGVEEIELTEPRRALEEAGATVHLLAPGPDAIQAMDHTEKSNRLEVERAVGDADPQEYDGLVLPGGVVNADHLRVDKSSVEFVRSFLLNGKPVGVICHGPWILIETGLLQGRTLTSYPTLQTDLRNAGATWVDEEVRQDGNLVSSRRPADLKAFCGKLIEVFSIGRAQRKAA
jgi:protease I